MFYFFCLPELPVAEWALGASDLPGMTLTIGRRADDSSSSAIFLLKVRGGEKGGRCVPSGFTIFLTTVVERLELVLLPPSLADGARWILELRIGDWRRGVERSTPITPDGRLAESIKLKFLKYFLLYSSLNCYLRIQLSLNQIALEFWCWQKRTWEQQLS